MNELKGILEKKSLVDQLDLDVVKQFLSKNLKDYKLKWKIIETNNFSSINEALKSQKVANVVVLAHGKENGFIIDSKDNELPREFFYFISPTIQSINLYSCYSTKSLSVYGLENKILNSESFYKIRVMTTVKENDFYDSNSYAPIATFPSYLKKLDSYLYDNLKGTQALQKTFGNDFFKYSSPKECSIDMSDLNVTKGNFAIVLNDAFLGELNLNNQTKILKFPCKTFKKENDNTLKILDVFNDLNSSEIANYGAFKILIHNDESGTTKTLEFSQAKLKTKSYIKFKF
jgi:hypothetical protein